MFRACYLFVWLFACSVGNASSDDDLVPAALIRVPASLGSVFVAEVDAARLHRYQNAQDGLVNGGSFYMSIGQAGAGKQRSGDKRTPLGVYFVTEQLDTSRLHEKYGPIAFPLDYPNAWDLRAERTGDGIWVHGVDPNGGKRPTLDTDGCIALQNNDLESLAPEFQDNVTPVIVLHNLDMVSRSVNEKLRQELEHAIAIWADSQAMGDLHAYLSSYDDAFRRWGMNRDEWMSLVTVGSGQRAIDDVAIADLLLLRYPEYDNLFLSRFQLTVVEGGSQVQSMRRLYWRRDEHGNLKIVAENDG